MNRKPFIPGMEFFGSEVLSASSLRDEPDWVLVERITGKKCPENVNLRILSRMTQTEMRDSLELSDAQAKKLSSALVLGERLANEAIERGMSINGARDVFRIFQGQMKDAKKEGFYAVTVDVKNKAMDIHRISEGTLSMTLVHPREAFNPVIRDSASGVIYIHNHPSGDPEPSKDDYLLTDRLNEAGNLLGIRVLDHVVIGDGDFVSLRDLGAFHEERTKESRAAESYRVRENAREGESEGKMSTAILRNRAMEAESRQDWKKAAEYYRLAIENYPPHHASSALATRDIELLTGSMKECLRMEASEKAISHSAQQHPEERKELPQVVRQRSRDGMGF